MVQVRVDLSWWLVPDNARVTINRIEDFEGNDYGVVVNDGVQSLIRMVHFRPWTTFNVRSGIIFLEC